MPLTLADASRLSPLEGAVDPAFDQWRQKNEIEGSPEVVKGWTSAGLGSQANSLYTQALKAQIDGDQQQSDVLRAQAQDLDQQTAQWAPRVQNVTDVRSLRDGADWLGGAMGNLRTSVAPAAAGLAGSIAGLAAAPFTGGIVNPVTAGFAAASAAGYDAEADESAAAALRDPNVMARNTPEEVLATARLKGIGNSALEAAVPTVMGGRLLTGAGVKALGRAALGRGATQAEVATERAAQQAIVNEGWKGAAKTVGANVAEGAAGEFTTESAQSLVGQAAQNSLLGKDLTDFDYKQAFNEGAAGAVAGGGMGVVGGAGQVGHAYLGAGTQAVKDTAKDVAADPVGKAADLIADAGAKAGELGAKALDWYERSTSEPHKALDSLVGSNIAPELVTPQAMKWAQFVMGDKNSTPDELADAKDFVSRVASGDAAAAEDYRNKLTVKHYERLNSEALNGISDEIESRLPKQSKMGMTEQGNISAQLSDLWLSTEGKNFGAFKNAASPDEAKRTALMMTHWIASGFGADHNDGETFIPAALIDGLGTEAAKVVLSLAKIVKKQGLYKGNDKTLMDMYSTVKQMAQDSSSDTEIIDQLLTPLARQTWNDSKTNVLTKDLRSRKGKTSKAQTYELEKSFGSNTTDLLKHFRERPEKAAKYGKALDIEGGVPVMDEGGDVTTDYESGLTERDATSRVSYQGQGKKNTPFNTLHEQQKNNQATLLSTFKNQPGVLTRTVGVHDALKEQYGKDHNYLREAENEAMWAAVKKMNSSKAEREEYMQHLDSLSEQERASQLKALNKTHKLVRVEQIEGDAVADQIRPDQVESFREERGERSTDVTPDRGILYLERELKTDKKTGEQTGADEDFLTSTHRLIKHTWAAEKRESEGRTDGDAGQGAKGEYEALLRGIAALVQSDGTFTGRVGFRMKPGDKVRYVKAGSVFPQELKMVSGTVLDAEKRHAVELSRKKADHWGAELGDEIQEATDNDNIVPSEHRGEKPIYRDSDGARVGAGEDAAGYEGNSRGGSGKGAEPVMIPLATAHTEGKLTTVPRSADAMKELLSDPAFPKGSLRILTSTEVSKLEHAIFSVKDLLGKMWNISHVAVAREGTISHLAEAVPLSDGSFAVVLKERLFSASLQALQAIFSHEVAHTFSWMKGERELFNEGGEVARLAANIPKTAALATLFRYPLDKQKFPEADFANEMHAQAFAAYNYPVLKRILKRDAPELFALLKELYGTQKTRTDRGDLQNSRGVLEASTSGSGQLGGEERNTVREGAATDGVHSSSERPGLGEQHQLEQYLKLAEGKNAILANALKKEIARLADGGKPNGNTTGVLKAAEKQLAGRKQSSQTANRGSGKMATKAEREAAMQHILDTLGDSVKGAFVKHFGDNSSGSWTPGKVKNIIRLALNGDVLGTAYHESLHEFFDQLKKAGSTATQEVLQRVATNPIINRKIERLLADHPAAAEQVRNSPEEAAAFMYQFWRAGLLKLGPEGQTLFEKIKSFFAGLLGKVSAEVRDMQHAEEVMQAFSSGVLKEDATREAVLKALNTNAEAHNAALENLDKAGRDLVREFGKVFFSSEAMLKGTKNKYMRNVAQMFHQETGEGKGDKQALLEATRQQMNIWTNRLENILTAYKPEDLELAREALSKNVPPKDRIAKEIVAKITNFNEDMFKYITSRGVKRLDDDGNWVPVQHRADYFRRVWDTDVVRENAEKFKSMLLEHHPKQLQLVADQANAEIKNGTHVEGSASAEQMAKKPADRETVTPEMVADAIIARLLNANGQVELEESTSSLGMSPVATSVNRRTLSWIDPQQFDEFTSKDIVNVMSGYVSSMVKRAEYTRVFGNTGEGLRALVDKATLEEMGGDEMVSSAEKTMPAAIKKWKVSKAKAASEGKYFDAPFPTLMSVGLNNHRLLKGDEAAIESLTKARRVLSQGYKAIMAMEGTLGAEMAPGLRKLNSALATYQSFRVLPLVLFSSINDVMGVVANGGKLGDAWNTFVSGIKEIKNSWAGTKSDGRDAVRAEEWGTVEATTRMEALGQLYGSMYMTGKARKLSNSFFKWNGMEGFNRGVRIAATVVAENAIKAFKTEGLDKNDAAAVARFEELFGKGFKPENIALDANGDLDIMNPINQAAVMRWVSKAVMSPNAAHRPIWGSDARMASVWMLKQFAYTFHRVMLKNAVAQAKLGNLRPALVMAVGYAPVAIAADVVKEALIPGDDPPWMKMGLGSYLQHGVSRAGLFGVPGMIYDSAVYDYGVGLLGPTASQAMHAPFDPVDKTMLGALPAGGRLKALADE